MIPSKWFSRMRSLLEFLLVHTQLISSVIFVLSVIVILVVIVIFVVHFYFYCFETHISVSRPACQLLLWSDRSFAPALQKRSFCKNFRYLFFCLQFGIYHGKVRSNVWKKFQQKLQIFFNFSMKFISVSVISTPLVLLSERILSSGEIFEYLALILPPNLEKPLCNLEASVIIC